MTKLTNAAARTILTAKLSMFDGGSLKFYTGAPPATTEAAATGTLVGTLTFAATAFTLNGAANGVDVVATAAAITRDNAADADGLVTYYRVLTSGGTTFEQGTVGEAASGADLILVDTDIAAGEPIEISAWTITKALVGG